MAGGEAHPKEEMVAVLRRLGLCRTDERPAIMPLTGGVSSDIYKVDLERGPVCVKRALSKLRVDADWYAPVERNAFEAAWMRFVAGVLPAAVPALIAQEAASGTLVMAYLPQDRYRLWKSMLRTGEVGPNVAHTVGERLVRIHAASAGDPALQASFASDDIFHDIRLEPYLLATARVHPDLGDVLAALAARTAAHRLALVHGDVSPKNLLIGPEGPVFLDAECAWYGDPAFDLAFCLNHLLLKCLWVPAAMPAFLESFDGLATAYLQGVDWEPAASLEGRAASLLPGLLLARIDGKSPIDYLHDQADRALARRIARQLLADPVATLFQVRQAWEQALTDRSRTDRSENNHSNKGAKA